MPNTITIRRGFDSHVHGRDGSLLQTVGPMTARQFWGAIFEPNLEPPITTAAMARSYRDRILAACADTPDFKPYVLAYLTDTLDPEDLAAGLVDGSFFGAKFYPKGATTNSDKGILDVRTLWTVGTPQFELIRVLAKSGRVIQLHCELNFDLDGNELDPYEREPYFFRHILPVLMNRHPDAKWSCEHLTCKEGVQFLVKHGGSNLGCSITPHHLLYDRRDMFRGGLRPHLFCLPVIKDVSHLRALRAFVTGGHPFVYAGTDSAPHDRRKKECDCCSGGVFTAHAAVELYAQAFDLAGALDDRFGQFLSVNGPEFYGLPVSDECITLERIPWKVDELIRYSDDPEDVVRPHGYEGNPDNRVSIEWRIAS